MKNMIKILGIIAFVAIIGFSMTSCDSDGNSDGNNKSSGGTFIITDIPQKFNGKFAWYNSYNQTTDEELWGLQSANISGLTFVKINNGRVVLPMWKTTETGIQRYSGNDTVTNGDLTILNTNKLSWEDDIDDILIAEIDFYQIPISFNNGSAEISANLGSLYDYE